MTALRTQKIRGLAVTRTAASRSLAFLDEGLYDVEVTFLGCHKQRSAPVHPPQIDIGVSTDQVLDDDLMPLLDCHKERGAAVRSPGKIHIGVSTDQELHNVVMPF